MKLWVVIWFLSTELIRSSKSEANLIQIRQTFWCQPRQMNADNPRWDRTHRKEAAPLGDGAKMLPTSTATTGSPISGPGGHRNHPEGLLNRVTGRHSELQIQWVWSGAWGCASRTGSGGYWCCSSRDTLWEPLAYILAQGTTRDSQ